METAVPLGKMKDEVMLFSESPRIFKATKSLEQQSSVCFEKGNYLPDSTPE